MAYKKYSDNFRAEALIRLAVNKYDYDKTAEQTGVTSRSLRNWEKDFTKNGIPELLERAIERMLMVIPSNMSGQEWAIALGILMDKWLLIQGEPTERTENLVRNFEALTDDERRAVVREAQDIIAGFGAVSIDGSNGREK